MSRKSKMYKRCSTYHDLTLDDGDWCGSWRGGVEEVAVEQDQNQEQETDQHHWNKMRKYWMFLQNKLPYYTIDEGKICIHIDVEYTYFKQN